MSSMGHPSFALVYAGAFALYHWERLFEPLQVYRLFPFYRDTYLGILTKLLEVVRPPIDSWPR